MVLSMTAMAQRGLSLSSRRTLATLNSQSVALRREDKSRWERRVALTPQAVAQLIRETGSRVYVQPSTKRIFTDQAYQKAGATVTEDISVADIILGIKEVPQESLIPNKTYLFFSHSHKGNEKNMPMLKTVLDKNIRLLDYELMKEDTGKRSVAFGQFAGNAGMIDCLHGMGHRFLGMGYSTPFMYTSMAYGYRSLDDAKRALGSVGDLIQENGTPKDFGPLVFAFTGDGNVTHGALDIFKALPHEFVSVNDLPQLIKDKNPKLNKVYATHLEIPDYIQHKKNGPCTHVQDYLAHPDNYQSVFHTKVAPYVNTVVTGAYWDERYPRLLTNHQLRDIQIQQEKGHIPKGKMMSLADIVCDIRGAFESLSHSTEIEDGFYYYDAIREREHKNAEEPGMQIMGIDILPTELPAESSEHFSRVLYPHLKELVKPSAIQLSDLPSSLANAAITDKGKLTPAHRGLEAKLSKTTGLFSKEKKGDHGILQPKTVLLLGSGMVAAPLVEHLLKRPDVRIVVASNATSEAKALVAGHDRAEQVGLDISNKSRLSSLVSKADVVVSFVPAFLHSEVARVCIERKKDMVTASYVSQEMQGLDDSAKNAGILIMNEVGLDPGMDHMSAMKIIDDAKLRGSKIRSFVSWCGGLPAPEVSSQPLGYKFSWSPRGVLTAGSNDATYWAGGKKHFIPGHSLLKNHFPSIHTAHEGLVFEGLANRDSLSYVDTYGLGSISDMDTMFRGTLRYQGYSDLMYAFKQLGFLDPTTRLSCTQWDSYFNQVLSLKESKDKREILSNTLGLSIQNPLFQRVSDAIDILSDFSPKGSEIPFPKDTTPLDAFSALLSHQLRYLPGERDMVAMHHEFGIEHSSGKKETLTSTMIHYGDDKHTAMATTVGLPAAMTTELILDNKISERGVLRPTLSHIYLPVLDQLENAGIKFIEKAHTFRPICLEATGSGLWNQ